MKRAKLENNIRGAILPLKALAEFKKIFMEEFGFELSDYEATQKATAVLNLFRILARPIAQKGEEK